MISPITSKCTVTHVKRLNGIHVLCSLCLHRYMLGLAAIPSALQFGAFLFMPESPRWLIISGQAEKARDVLSRLRGRQSGGEEEEEYQTIRSSILSVIDETEQRGTCLPAPHPHVYNMNTGVWSAYLHQTIPTYRPSCLLPTTRLQDSQHGFIFLLTASVI